MRIDSLSLVSKCVLINEKNQFLILKRTEYKREQDKHLWDLPGGNADQDEDINAAVKREVQEEVGITLKEADVLYTESGKAKTNSQFVFILFVSRKYEIEHEIKLSHEHSEYKWISVDEMDDYSYFVHDSSLKRIKSHLKVNQSPL